MVLVSPAETQRKHQSGFTMIEAMVAVAVLAILASIAVPDMLQFLNARRVEDAARRIGEDIAFARIEAVKRNSPVLLCAGTGEACAANPLTTDWSTGWRVCYDLDANGVCDETSTNDPNPMRTVNAIHATLRLTGPTSALSFSANGTIVASNFSQFTVASTSTAVTNWAVRIAASGAVSVRKATL